jgi:hypothetical protein
VNVSGSPLGSCDALPSSVAMLPSAIVWSAPAFATGGRFSPVITTGSGGLSTVPSLTMSCAM